MKSGGHAIRSIPVALDLPDDLCREIGRVIVGHAWLDWGLSQILYDLLKINPKEGRLAVREPRTQDRFEVILDLLALKGIAVTAPLQEIKSLLEDCTVKRDQVAHGIWGRDGETGELYLRLTKGRSRQIKGSKGVKRVIQPEAIPYGESDCRALKEKIDRAISAIAAMRSEIERELLSKMSSS